METNTQVIERLIDRVERLSYKLAQTQTALDAAIDDNETRKIPRINPGDLAYDLVQLARKENYKIMAIKLLRNICSIPLREAKDLIDAKWDKV